MQFGGEVVVEEAVRIRYQRQHLVMGPGMRVDTGRTEPVMELEIHIHDALVGQVKAHEHHNHNFLVELGKVL